MLSADAGAQPRTVGELLTLRDSMAVVVNLAACLALACQAPTLPRAERHALGAVIDIVRDRVEAMAGALDAMIESEGGVSSAS